MPLAQRIASQISSHFNNRAINYRSLVGNLKAGFIDEHISIAEKLGLDYHEAMHCGAFSGPDNELPAIFYFDDRSVLVITPNNITSSVQC